MDVRERDVREPHDFGGVCSHDRPAAVKIVHSSPNHRHDAAHDPREPARYFTGRDPAVRVGRLECPNDVEQVSGSGCGGEARTDCASLSIIRPCRRVTSRTSTRGLIVVSFLSGCTATKSQAARSVRAVDASYAEVSGAIGSVELNRAGTAILGLALCLQIAAQPGVSTTRKAKWCAPTR